MRTVQTVLGPVEGKDLGIVDIHDHLYADPPRWYVEQYPDFDLTDLERSAQELESWRRAGGGTLVEMTAIDYGRRASALVALAQRVPVHIVATTGFNKPLYCERWVEEWPEEQLVQRIVRDLTEGMDGTSARAGVIKAGTAYNVATGLGERLVRVAARASLLTGAPIVTHTEAGTMGMEQLDLIADEGVDLSNVCLTHLDRNPDPGYHLELAARGAYLGYDCPGKIKYGPDSLRIAAMKGVIEGGYGDRLLLGNDLARRSYFRSYGGGPGLDFVLTRYVPRLRKELGDTWVDRILVENPRRFLAQE
jgi:predicted metal-dependent phosphotriesterase family hydrolase